MKLAQRIDARFPQGFFIAAATVVLGWLKRLSLGRALSRSLSKNFGPAPGKLHAWLGDTYVILCLCASILLVFLLATLSIPSWLQLVFALAAGYRLFELGVFVLGWTLVDAGPLHSYRRSVIGFSLNILEVAGLAAVFDGVTICGDGASFLGWWSHLSSTVALDGADVLSRCGICRVVPIVRFGFGVVLMLLAFATLAGGLIRNEIGRTPERRPD